MITLDIDQATDQRSQVLQQAVSCVNFAGYEQDSITVDVMKLAAHSYDTLVIKLTPRALTLASDSETIEFPYDCDALRAIVREYGVDCGCQISLGVADTSNCVGTTHPSKPDDCVVISPWLCVVAVVICVLAGFIAGRNL